MFVTLAPTSAARCSRFVNARIDRLATSGGSVVDGPASVGAPCRGKLGGVTRGRFRPIRTAVLVTLIVIGSLFVATGGASALGQLSYDGCISVDGSSGLCASSGTTSLQDGSSVAISPDGTSAYATSYAPGAITMLNRASTGQLAYAGCVSNDGSGGSCVDAPGAPLSGAAAVVVSADGRSVYVGSYSSHAIVTFDRAPDGQLTYGGCVSDVPTAGLCADSPGSLAGVYDLAISPDGRTLYTAVSDGVTVFDRAPSGQLTYAGCASDDGTHGLCADVPGTPLISAHGVAVSHDGTSVYVISAIGTVTVFDRSAGGQITYASCVSDDGSDGRCADAPGAPLNEGAALAVSPADDSVYVVSGTATITAFDRAAKGQLTYAGCVSDDGSGGLCADAPGSPIFSPTDVAVSNDGGSVYVSSFAGIVSVFDRADHGQITYAGCASDDGSAGLCGDLPGTPLSGALSIAVSPDDGSVYTAAYYAGTVVHLFRKTTPDTRIVSGPEEGSTISAQRPTFAFASDQDGASFECAVDDQPYTACASPDTLGPLVIGDHRLAVRAITGGDADRTPATRTFRIVADAPVAATDPGVTTTTTTPGVKLITAAPRVRIVHGPRSTIRTRQPTVKVRFTLAVDKPGATLRCKLDSRPTAPCRSPVVYVVHRGHHQLVVQAVDRLGNVGKPVRRSFNVTKPARRSAHS